MNNTVADAVLPHADGLDARVVHYWQEQLEHRTGHSAILFMVAYDLPFLSLAVCTSRRLATDTLLAAKPPSDLVSPAQERKFTSLHDLAPAISIGAVPD